MHWQYFFIILLFLTTQISHRSTASTVEQERHVYILMQYPFRVGSQLLSCHIRECWFPGVEVREHFYSQDNATEGCLCWQHQGSSQPVPSSISQAGRGPRRASGAKAFLSTPRPTMAGSFPQRGVRTGGHRVMVVMRNLRP